MAIIFLCHILGYTVGIVGSVPDRVRVAMMLNKWVDSNTPEQVNVRFIRIGLVIT